ncbi:MAG TPA: OmpH family outer membrane protein [Bacteroidales bacterium]|jgi:Skp family chaperone for outer membrane proteins|nr:OmpH family outer membrane protein [Bacteroidales bacterium]
MEEINEKNSLTDDKKVDKKILVVKKRKFRIQYVFYALVIIAVAILYVLHFTKSSPKTSNIINTGTPGTGEILFVNIDTISEKYKLVDILTEDIESEVQKQTAIFDNKEKSFQNKYNQFQKNYEAGILTEVQIQNATAQLQEEYQTILQEKQTVLSSLEERHATALIQVADSVKKIAKEVNQQKYNASYIFIYQTGGQMIYGDPMKDITYEVLEILNRHYK